MSNPISWFEIYVQDMARAKRFYEAVLQVAFKPLSAPGAELEMWSFPGDMDSYGASGALVHLPGCPSGGNATLVYFACADGNTGIRGIRWTAWTPLSAQGTGEYFENNCIPDCAEGKFSFTPVALWLDTPIQMGNEIYLTQLGYQQIDATGRIVNSGIGGNNDMAAMYINMYTETASPTPSANSSK